MDSGRRQPVSGSQIGLVGREDIIKRPWVAAEKAICTARSETQHLATSHRYQFLHNEHELMNPSI